jgi:hypothetical protein
MLGNMAANLLGWVEIVPPQLCNFSAKYIEILNLCISTERFEIRNGFGLLLFAWVVILEPHA